MKRLTARDSDDWVWMPGRKMTKKDLSDAMFRLCEIEDILGDSYDLHLLRRLVDAERAGRLVVLPCKKDDRLFVLTSDSPTGVEETKAKRIMVSHRENGPCAKIMAPCVYDDWGGAFREFYSEDFGKTVFLTYEEAEAARANTKSQTTK